LNGEAIYEQLRDRFPDKVSETRGQGPLKCVYVKPEAIEEVLIALRDQETLGFRHLSFISGIDLKEAIEVAYGLISYSLKVLILLKVTLDHENPTVRTVSHIFSAANWHERETFDLFGVKFEGHPDLRRLLLPEDWKGHPLRKDYKEEPFYHEMPTTREPLLGRS
jgi:NADH-quinone oxidoreductase subunit C